MNHLAAYSNAIQEAVDSARENDESNLHILTQLCSLDRRLLHATLAQPMYPADINELPLHIGIPIEDRTLLKRAMTLSEQDTRESHNNEPLEFLGDSVLHVILKNSVLRTTTQIDRQKYSVQHQYDAFAKRSHLARATTALGTAQWITPHLLTEKQAADVMEALVGAIFLDAERAEGTGYEYAQQFIQRHIIGTPKHGMEHRDSVQTISDVDVKRQAAQDAIATLLNTAQEGQPTAIEGNQEAVLEQLRLHLQFPHLPLPLLAQALTHRSSATTPKQSNEDLVILGDAVWDLASRWHLYIAYPELSVHQWTRLNGRVKAEAAGAYVAEVMDLERYLRCDKNVKRKASLYAETAKAIFGAVFRADREQKRPMSDTLETLSAYIAPLAEHAMRVGRAGDPVVNLTDECRSLGIQYQFRKTGPKNCQITLTFKSGRQLTFDGRGEDRASARKHASEQTLIALLGDDLG